MTTLQFIGYARKFLVAVIAALGVTAFTLTAGSDAGVTISPSEWIQIIIAFAGALGVYATKNKEV